MSKPDVCGGSSNWTWAADENKARWKVVLNMSLPVALTAFIGDSTLPQSFKTCVVGGPGLKTIV
jgi:hypothetical protein